MANLTIEQRLAAIGTGLNAPSNVPQIGTLLAPYGYADYRDVAVVALEGHPEWIELIRQGSVE